MNIHSLDRFALINNIRIAWKTDFMYNHIKVRNMPVFKAEFTNPFPPKIPVNKNFK